MEKKYSLWLQKCNISDGIKYALVKAFGDARGVYEASDQQLGDFGLNAGQKERLLSFKKELPAIERELLELATVGVQLVTIEEARYPRLLKEIYDPPLALFVKGDVQVLDRPMIAVVGARKCSEYGYRMAQQLSLELARRGLCVVSGLARGIDEAAHKGAIAGGKSIAVLGTGVDRCYPAGHRELYERLQGCGGVISEFSLGTEPMPFHFPKRNRIISGMCFGTVVIEAAEKSGSLITTDLALEQNREVFAVPGNIDSQLSRGTNALIQKGCKLIMSVEDILDEFPEYVMRELQYNKENGDFHKQNILDKVEIMVYDCLSWQPTSLETLSMTCQIDEKVVQHILLKLELQGLILRLPANRYIRNNAK
ncbi:MAG: DNA-processing protein DprA [Cellulosilyticaceae bacterium]